VSSRGRYLAGVAGAAFAMAACGVPAPPPETRLPNIVLIVPDDLGRHDVSFHGGEIATPNIDRIAAEGVLIERFYTAPICSPTRAGLMTGRYPIRYGLMRNVIAPWQDFGLDTEEVTIPEVLARAGYEHRGVFGKWHLGHIGRKYHPLRRGFTESVGHNTSIDYFTKERFGERDWFHGYEPASEEGYVTDLVAEHAVRFIDRRAGGETPFFLYVPFNAAHSPLQAKEEDLPLYADLEAIEPPRSWEEITAGGPLAPEEQRRERRRVHAAMVHALDEGVGRILQAIDDHDIAENTPRPLLQRQRRRRRRRRQRSLSGREEHRLRGGHTGRRGGALAGGRHLRRRPGEGAGRLHRRPADLDGNRGP